MTTKDELYDEYVSHWKALRPDLEGRADDWLVGLLTKFRKSAHLEEALSIFPKSDALLERAHQLFSLRDLYETACYGPPHGLRRIFNGADAELLALGQECQAQMAMIFGEPFPVDNVEIQRCRRPHDEVLYTFLSSECEAAGMIYDGCFNDIDGKAEPELSAAVSLVGAAFQSILGVKLCSAYGVWPMIEHLFPISDPLGPFYELARCWSFPAYHWQEDELENRMTIFAPQSFAPRKRS